MKPNSNEMLGAQMGKKFQGQGPNWILITGGALLSTLSVRLGYRLKQVLDLRQPQKTNDGLKGPVTNFKLFVSNRFKIDDEDIHHWVMLLSRLRGLMEFTLMNWRHTVVKLPTHLFSCLELRSLTLDRCVFPHCFRGFPKLLSLHLENVYIQDHRCGELIAQCPLLENLQIWNWNSNLGGELKLVEIAELKNLKMLRLSLCLLDTLTMLRLSTVLQQMSLLPKLQELSLAFKNCKFLPEDVAQIPVSSNFPFLKTLSLWQMDFSSVSMLSCAFGMLFGCANLQTLRIRATYKNVVPLPAINLPEVDCSTMRQLQLQNVTLGSIKGRGNYCIVWFFQITQLSDEDDVSNWGLLVFGDQKAFPSYAFSNVHCCSIFHSVASHEVNTLVELSSESGLLTDGWLLTAVCKYGEVEESVAKWAFHLMFYSIKEVLRTPALDFWCAILLLKNEESTVQPFLIINQNGHQVSELAVFIPQTPTEIRNTEISKDSQPLNEVPESTFHSLLPHTATEEISEKQADQSQSPIKTFWNMMLLLMLHRTPL